MNLTCFEDLTGLTIVKDGNLTPGVEISKLFISIAVKSP